MNDAFDTVRNHRVEAKQATVSTFPGRFLCPLCKTAVSYASGPAMVAHFRHVRGKDHDACERYAKHFHINVPFSRFESDHHDAVLVAKQTHSANGSQITFAVRFRPAYKVNYINLISGDSSIPYTIHAGVRQQFFRITSVERAYVIKALGPTGQEEAHIIEGFSEIPSIFRSSESESVCLSPHRLLKPGDYLVASRHELVNSFHPALEATCLMSIAGLFATRIRIPNDPSAEVRKNIRSLLQFEVVSRVADYAFIAPSIVTELASDCWEVEADADLELLIKIPSKFASRSNQLFVQKRVSGHLTGEYLPLPYGARSFIAKATAGSGRPELLRLGISEPPQFIIEVNFSSFTQLPLAARLLFSFGIKNRAPKKISWSSHVLREALLSATDGTIDLNSIEIPKSIEMSIADSDGKRHFLNPPLAAMSLISHLRKMRFPVTLMATGYPNLVLSRKTVRRKVIVRAERESTYRAHNAREARMVEARRRGCVSLYSVEALRT